MPEPIVFPLDLDEVRATWITRDTYGRLCGESRLYSQSDIAELLEGLRRARGDIQSIVAEVTQLRKQVERVEDHRLIRLAISDPGAFLQRGFEERGGERIYESIPNWGARAVREAVHGESAEQHGEAATS